MCGRYCIAVSPGEISDRYRTDTPESFKPGFNIAPGSTILTIISRNGVTAARMHEWGIQVQSGRPVVNARIETIHTKPLFSQLINTSRCLIPASGYFEWRKEGRAKIPYYVTSPDHDLLSFAGIIKPGAGGGQVAILTTRAFPKHVDIHDRMPVVLSPENELQYLHEGAIAMITEPLQVCEVSDRVNTVGEDGPDLIEPRRSQKRQKTLEDW